MQLKNIDELKQQYIGNTYNKLTVVDILRVGKQWILSCKCECGNICNKEFHKVISGHTKTCGAYVHKLEQAKRQSQLYKDNPEIGKRAGAKLSQWYKENRDKIKKRSDEHREWWNNHTEQREYQSQYMTNKYLTGRKNADYTELLEILNPKYAQDLLSGNIKRDDLIETLCPLCKQYGKHTFHSLFYVSKNKLKYNHALLCNKCQREKTSHYEIEIANYIKSFYDAIPIKNSRAILKRKELDLYYPDKRIAIEFNGDYWHSEVFKDNLYHYNKLKSAVYNGITLVTIFESEWNNKKDSIKSYIRDLFSGIENELSYVDNLYINNNYPPPYITADKLNYIEKSYLFNDKRVFTCGLSMK